MMLNQSSWQPMILLDPNWYETINKILEKYSKKILESIK